MNMFGFTLFSQEVIADAVAAKTGKTVKMGRLNWQADSFHIYGKDIQAAKERLFDRLATTDFEDRVYEFHDEMIHEMYDEAEAEVTAKIKAYDAAHQRP
jgi:thymidylate synthase